MNALLTPVATGSQRCIHDISKLTGLTACQGLASNQNSLLFKQEIKEALLFTKFAHISLTRLG